MNKIEQYRQYLNKCFESNKSPVIYWTYERYLKEWKTPEDIYNIYKFQKLKKYSLLSKEDIEKAKQLLISWMQLKEVASKFNVSIAYFYYYWIKKTINITKK